MDGDKFGEKKIKYGPGNCEDIIGIKGYKAKGQIISYLLMIVGGFYHMA